MDAATEVPISWLVAAVSVAVSVTGSAIAGLLRARVQSAESALQHHGEKLQALEIRLVASETGQRDIARRLDEIARRLDEILHALAERRTTSQGG